ncbi:hypothetical protein EI983_01255 [Roseovarius faecimaris]|uniref:DUF4157 domain-containing protein n=1 Tax=Roseovarius faecimaris TaxID=2494550 RepID=A0A6I6IM77_9RHOB|nr:hypothetical protein [Roseovarius faecimaris]QGX96971.1 hypothetical protein EI983_01255 [Roseovarius faecimaris]
MRVVLLFSLLFVVSCGRPLTEAEKAFATDIHGQSLAPERVRFVNGALVGSVTYQRQKRPRLACRERIFPEPTSDLVTVGPAAVALHNRVFYTKPFYLEDYMENYPQEIDLYAAMIFAHEITHVWQWQNRRSTGYSPLRAGNEHLVSDDPYLFDITTETSFLEYGFEQQAGIVEEYVCCATLDPDAPRTKRLEKLLRGAFPMGRLAMPKKVTLPWDEAETKGICR